MKPFDFKLGHFYNLSNKVLMLADVGFGLAASANNLTHWVYIYTNNIPPWSVRAIARHYIKDNTKVFVMLVGIYIPDFNRSSAWN
jgi:hypothetical protein